jgi:hypothetical protein
MKDDLSKVPVLFWQTMSPEEFSKFAIDQDGWLNAEQCARLWRMEDRQGEPPKRLQILLNRDEFIKKLKL